MKRWLEPIALWVVLALAALGRFYALDIHPVGANHDVASNGAYTLQILYNGARPFFIWVMGATEPLILYLQSISVAWLGPNMFALRAVTALANVLAVAMLYLCANEFTRDHRIGLVAAFAYAVSMELIAASREGLRYTLVPLFEITTLYFFWRGWRDGHMRDFVVAGIVLGISHYAYIAALILPVIFVALWAYQFLFDRARWRARLPGTLAMALVFAAIAAPRWIFQLAYPSAALSRAGSVSILQNPDVQQIGLANVIFARLLASAKMFGVEWQGGSFHQPIFDLGMFALFVIGVVLCLARWKKIEWVWAPLTLAIAFVPDFLGANEPAPNKLRAISIFAPAFFFVGVGTVALLDTLKRIRLGALGYAGLGVIFLFSAYRGLDPFLGPNAATQPPFWVSEDFNVSRVETAQVSWMLQQRDPIFVPLNEYAHNPIRFLIGARAPRMQSALHADGSLDPRINVSRAWVLVTDVPNRLRVEGRAYTDDPYAYVLITDGIAYFLPPTKRDIPTVEAQLHQRSATEQIRDTQGEIAAHAYHVDDANTLFQFALAPVNSTSAKFSQGIELTAAILDSRAPPGDTINVSLFWRIAQKTDSVNMIFVHLLDTDNAVAAGADVIPALGAYPTDIWKPGEIIATHHAIKIPARTPPGRYIVEIGMYSVVDQNRLDVLDERGMAGDSRVIVGSVKVAPRTANVYNPARIQSANFDQRIALTGFDLPIKELTPGHTVNATLYWRAIAPLDRDYTIFAHVVDANGNIIAQSDHQPQTGRYPTLIWDVGEHVRDDFTLEIPADAPNTKYSIRVGWYDAKTGIRLPVRDTNNYQLVGDYITLEDSR